MHDIYLSDQAIRDRQRDASKADHSLKALSNAVRQFTSINDFLIQTRIPQNWEIKRLKCKPMAWRHHDSDFRTVFTVSEVKKLAAFIVLRVAHRAVVYKGLERYLEFDPEILQLLKNNDLTDENEDQFTAKQLSNSQILDQYNRQGKDNNYAKKSCLRIHQLRGGAGTGKTTSVFQLALEAVNQGAYPIIVVPNASLQRFGVTFTTNKQPELKICEKLNDNTPSNAQISSDLAILTKAHLLKHLAGDSCEEWNNSVGNFKIRQILREKNVEIPNYLDNINLYSLYLGIIAGAYDESTKDPLLRELENLGAVDFIEKYYQHHQRFFKEALKERDAASQAERIQGKWDKFIEVMSYLLNISDEKSPIKPPILIIDEVQDFYWCQLKAILAFYKIRFLMDKRVPNASIFYPDSKELSITFQSVSKEAGRLVILAGDNNQRVTFSGFSWDNLATTFRRDFPNHEPFEIPNAFSCNHRNTSQITLAANYILSAQGTALKAFKIDSQKSSWIDAPPSPEKCKNQEGLKPQIIEADESYVKELIDALASLKSLNENECLVFIYNEDSSKHRNLWEYLKEISEKVNHLMCLSVAEAKGQEFDAVVIVFPFARCPESPSINELFTWYTALTRAKKYVAILISPDEKRWLDEKTINCDDLEKVFCINKIDEQDDLTEIVQELSENGIVHTTIHDLVRNVFRKIEKWLQGQSQRNNLLTQIQNVWEIMDEIEIGYDEFGKEITLTSRSFEHFSLEDFEAKEALVIYIALLPLLLEIIEDDTSTIDAQLMKKLENYFQQNPEELENAKNQISTPVTLCLIYRASQQSWEAVKALEHCNSSLISQFLYQGISQDLIKRGLPWEAARLCYHYLNENSNHQKSLPFPELLKQSGDLPDLLIDYLWNLEGSYSILSLSSNSGG